MALRYQRKIRRRERIAYQANYQRSQSKPFKLNLKRILGFMALVGILFVLIILSNLRSVIITGDATEAMSSQVRSDIRGENRFWLGINEDRVEQQLKAKYKAELMEVSVSKDWWQRSLKVELHARKAAILWRGRQGVFALDQTGVAMRPMQATDKKLPLVVDASRLGVAEGDKVSPEHFIQFVIDVNRSLPLKISQMRIIDTTSELYVDTKDGYSIRFSTRHSVSDQITNLKAVVRNARRQGLPITQYVDLRIPYKAYYR